jgi:uncharacterized protein
MIYRIVLDSNVIISGFLFGGAPADLLECALSGAMECFTSLPILDEVREVLQRPKFGLSPGQALSLIEELHDLCEVVTPNERVSAVTADEDDDAVLECALAAAAHLVVSGDSHLLELKAWRGIRMFSPAAALSEIRGQQAPRTRR